jgi:hypothetical protein
LAIISPKDNASLQCEEITDDGRCSITVDVSASGKLPESTKVWILVRARGESKWQVSAAAEFPEEAGNTLSISHVTLGSMVDTKQHYTLMAIATKLELETRAELSGIPQHVARSSRIHVSVSKDTGHVATEQEPEPPI